MTQLTDAMRTALLSVSTVPDEDLDWMEETIRRADTLSFFLVSGIDFPNANERLEDQKELLKLVRAVKAWGKTKVWPGIKVEIAVLGVLDE